MPLANHPPVFRRQEGESQHLTPTFCSIHPDFQIHEKEEYTFHCPICHATLNREENPNLVKIYMKDGDESFEVYFSSLAGEKCTYKISDKSIEQIGPDANHYKQYFDVPDEDKKYL